MTWDYVGLVSKDLEASVCFYRLLGCNFPDPNGEDHVEAVFENGMRFALDSIELIKRISEWEEPVGHRMGMGFNAGTPTNVDAIYRAVLDEGFTSGTEPFDAFWGQRYAQLIDPDGNKVDVYANL